MGRVDNVRENFGHTPYATSRTRQPYRLLQACPIQVTLMRMSARGKPRTKVSAQDVREMRAAAARGDSVSAIHLAFGPKTGLSFWQINKIILGFSWKHLEP